MIFVMVYLHPLPLVETKICQKKTDKDVLNIDDEKLLACIYLSNKNIGMSNN